MRLRGSVHADETIDVVEPIDIIWARVCDMNNRRCDLFGLERLAFLKRQFPAAAFAIVARSQGIRLAFVAAHDTSKQPQG